MLRIARLCLILLPVSALPLSPVAAWEFSSKEELLAAYEPAAERLKRFYTNLYIAADITKSNWVYLPRKPSDESVEFRANGRLIRSDRVIQAGAHPDTIVQVGAAERGFVVSKRSDARRFVLDSWHANPDVTVESSRLFNPLPFAPYCILEVTIPDLLKRGGVRLTDTQEVKKEGELLLKATFHETFKREGRVFHTSFWFLFAPERSWACRGYRYGTVNPECAEIEYEAEVDGIPLVKSALYWKEDKGKRVNMTRAKVTRLIPGPVPEDQFTLEAFGIAEPQERAGRAWKYAVAGALLLMVALVLGFWRSGRFHRGR